MAGILLTSRLAAVLSEVQAASGGGMRSLPLDQVERG
jgi:hypothetical protein